MLDRLSRLIMLITASLLAGSATAQDQLFRSVDVAPGGRVRLGIHGNVSPKCEPGALPEIKVVTPPKNGTLAVNSGKTRAGTLARCSALEVPAQAVIYQAKPRYSGPDEVAYQVIRPNRPTQSITIKINVGATGKPAPQRKEGGVEL